MQKEPLLGQKEFNLIHKNTRYDEVLRQLRSSRLCVSLGRAPSV